MSIKRFAEPSAVLSFTAASVLVFGSILSPVSAALATSSRLEPVQVSPTTGVETARFWDAVKGAAKSAASTGCSFIVFVGTLGTATDFNYRACM
jgi:hypothetical protein